MDFKYSEKGVPKKYQRQFKNLLIAEDLSFIPPLSQRTSTIQNIFIVDESIDKSIEPYYNSIKHQSFTFFIQDNQLAGFVSYIKDFDCKAIEESKCLYVSTIIVNKKYRGLSLTEKFYTELSKLSNSEKTPIVTRTWHTNAAHLHILDKMGFKKVKTITNDRGNDIDTVYYIKSYDID